MIASLKEKSIWMGTCGGWHLNHTADAFFKRHLLAGLSISDKNSGHLPSTFFHRCWPFHLAMKLFYHWAPQIWVEKLFYFFFPIWRSWLLRQPWPDVEVVHAIMGYATEPFDRADQTGALKVIDAPNSHPTTYFGYWQRECDLWCPGEKVPIPRWMWARMNRELERADLVIVGSTFCKESMIANGIPPGKIMVNPMGADTKMFTKREHVPEKIRFIAVGTICLRKGHQYLFRAFRLVKRRIPEAELICVGEYKSDFRMERPKWEGTFTHYPHLPHQELAALLRTCTAFVFPSQEEGFARVQTEAMASGLPLIGTHEGGITTVVDDGVEGFVVRGSDPEHIAEAMIKLALDRDLNQRMGDAAYKKGALKNSWLDYGDRLIAEYRRRCDEKKHRKPAG
jgi:glycosyltransferase involved in cell wall biosynthesis